MTHLSNAPATAPTPTPIDCETAVRRLWDYLDDRLLGLAREEVEAHLATCEMCARRFTFAARMQRTLAESAAPAVSGEEELRLRARVLGTLKRLSAEEATE